jgi:hypothetical protein
MTNKLRQEQLDKAKWFLSETNQEDMSGAMFYCDVCEKQRNGFVCGANQEERECKFLCAKAYNRLGRKLKK